MKLSYIIATPEVRPGAQLGLQTDFDSGVAAIADLGYDGVELMVRDPDEMPIDTVRRCIERHDLAVCCLCTGEVWGQDGIGFVSADAGIRAEARRRMHGFIDIAAELGADVNIGRFRGLLPDSEPWRAMLRWGLPAFREAADHAARHGVKLLIEPIMRTYANWIHSSEDGVDLVRSLGHPGFGLMLDLAHMAREDPSIQAGFHSAAGIVTHVHITEPDRTPPGDGCLDFPAILRVLREIGYDGYLSAELVVPDHLAAARLTLERMQAWIKQAETPVEEAAP